MNLYCLLKLCMETSEKLLSFNHLITHGLGETRRCNKWAWAIALTIGTLMKTFANITIKKKSTPKACGLLFPSEDDLISLRPLCKLTKP